MYVNYGMYLFPLSFSWKWMALIDRNANALVFGWLLMALSTAKEATCEIAQGPIRTLTVGIGIYYESAVFASAVFHQQEEEHKILFVYGKRFPFVTAGAARRSYI